jgi:hypothetical protein
LNVSFCHSFSRMYCSCLEGCFLGETFVGDGAISAVCWIVTWNDEILEGKHNNNNWYKTYFHHELYFLPWTTVWRERRWWRRWRWLVEQEEPKENSWSDEDDKKEECGSCSLDSTCLMTFRSVAFWIRRLLLLIHRDMVLFVFVNERRWNIKGLEELEWIGMNQSTWESVTVIRSVKKNKVWVVWKMESERDSEYQ